MTTEFNSSSCFFTRFSQQHVIMKSVRSLALPFLLTTAVASDRVSAHFPWLATDDQSHAVMWFGESTDDRAYPMPAKVRGIELKCDGDDATLAMDAVDSGSLVGIKSNAAINSKHEIFGSVTYGLYHGTKLTYHVEHLPGSDASAWPTSPRKDAPMQAVVTPNESGGVNVSVLRDGKPMSDTEVKLFCGEGHEEASKKTDGIGMVSFSSDEVEPGLNAIMVSITDNDAKGTYDDAQYTSATDYLTATFYIGDGKLDSVKSNQPAPQVDPNSGASVAPSGLPDLPEELTSFGAAIAGDKVYVYGGHTGSAHSYSIDEQSDRFWCLDLGDTANGWQKLSSGPSLQGLALVAMGDRVIRIGGFTAMNKAGEDHDLQSQSSVAVYDPASQAWSDLPSLPEARSSLDAAVLGNKVYVFGGWNLRGDSDESQWHSTAWSLDLSDASAKWQPLASPTFQRRAISVAALDGKLFVIGGMQADGGPTTKVDVYDPASDSWTVGHPIPGSGMSGFGSSAFATGGHLYVSTMDGFVHGLADDQKLWTTIAKADPARFFHRMLPTDDSHLLMIGGANMEIGKFVQIDRISLAAHSR